MRLTYLIDGHAVSFEGGNEADFFAGEGGCLSRLGDDPVAGKNWYEQGFAVIPSAPFFDAAQVRADVEAVVARTIADLQPGLSLEGFRLQQYHRFVDADLHAQVIARTRRLYPPDFGFDAERVVRGLSDYFGIELGYRPGGGAPMQWIIVRINPPGSVGFNPAHKDIYETYDAEGTIPRMVNVWIPVCGVGEGAGLPVSPRSHLVPEADVVRTRAGSLLEGQHYSVNCIRSWGGRNDLTTLCPAPEEMLVFSSHLIHGLGRNLHSDTTRVSLEFRLYAA